MEMATVMNRLIITSGGFDPVHIGHIRMFKEAKSLGDCHNVILNDDAFLLRKKKYVFMPLDERREILYSIKYIDVVTISIDKDDSVCETLKMIYYGHIFDEIYFANGGDRKEGTEIREAKVCEELGIKLIFNVGGDKIQSSSNLVNKSKIG